MRYIVHIKVSNHVTLQEHARIAEVARRTFDNDKYIVIVTDHRVSINVKPQWVYTMQVGWSAFIGNIKKWFI